MFLDERGNLQLQSLPRSLISRSRSSCPWGKSIFDIRNRESHADYYKLVIKQVVKSDLRLW